MKARLLLQIEQIELLLPTAGTSPVAWFAEAHSLEVHVKWCGTEGRRQGVSRIAALNSVVMSSLVQFKSNFIHTNTLDSRHPEISRTSISSAG